MVTASMLQDGARHKEATVVIDAQSVPFTICSKDGSWSEMGRGQKTSMSFVESSDDPQFGFRRIIRRVLDRCLQPMTSSA